MPKIAARSPAPIKLSAMAIFTTIWPKSIVLASILPGKNLSEKAKKVFLYGTEKKWTRMHFVHPVTGAHWTDHVQWRGVLHEAHTRFAEAKSEIYRKKMQNA